MFEQQKKITIFHLAGIFLAAFVMTVPIWIYGIPDPEDVLRHFQFSQVAYDSLSEGNLYLQGEPDLNAGYGGVGLRFYPPFTYYLLAIFYFFTHDWYAAGFLFFWFATAVGGIGVYFLAREWLSKNFAFLAGLLFTIDSFRSAQIQLSYAYAEFTAGCVLTFCFLFAQRTLRRGSLADLAGLAAAFGLLLLTHIPLTLIGSFSLLLFCAVSIGANPENFKKKLLKLTAAVSLGTLAAAFHWVRVLTESAWINHSASKFLKEGFFNFQNHFIDVRSTFFPGDLIFLNFLIFFVPSVLIYFAKPNLPMLRKLSPLILFTLSSAAMATSLSAPIWENIEPLQKIQFPWRWLTVTTIGAAVLTAAGAQVLKTLLPGRKTVIAFWIGVCLLANGYFTTAYITGSNLIDPEFFLVDRETLNRRIEDKRFARHHLPFQNIWAKEAALTEKTKVLTETAQREIEIIAWKGFDKEFKIARGEAATARVAQFYYPYWQAEINGKPAAISAAADGAILIELPPDEAGVRLKFVEPLKVKFFIFVSIASWLTIFSLFLLNYRQGKFQTPLQSEEL